MIQPCKHVYTYNLISLAVKRVPRLLTFIKYCGF